MHFSYSGNKESYDIGDISFPYLNIQKHNGVLVGLCNPLLDVTVEVDKKFLEEHDLKPNDAIMADEPDLVQELLRDFHVKFSAGGAGQNTMRRAQSLLPPGSTIYFGCVGKDDLASQMRRAAEKAGVNVRYMLDANRPTGTCATLLSDKGKNRSMVAHLSAAQHFHMKFLQEQENMDLIDNAKIYYATGFILPVSSESSMLLASKAAASRDKLMTINLSAPFVSQYYYDDLMKLLPLVDIVFGNEQEARAFAIRHGIKDTLNNDVEELKMITKAMASIPRNFSAHDWEMPLKNRLVIITQGPNPTIVSDGDNVLSFPVEPFISEHDIVNTNGAGDAFVAGVLSQILHGKTIREAINTGHKLAGDVIRTSEIIEHHQI